MAKPPPFSGWTAHGWGITVSTPHQLFRAISNIALLGRDRTFAWRGQNDASYDLSSSLYRELRKRDGSVTEGRMRAREQEILEEARRWGLGRDLGSSATDLHLLAILQHHGVPTRLIDVTSNPMTALWFAAEEHRPDSDGRIRSSDGVLFAIDVTDTPWHETFEHGRNASTWDHLSDSLGASYAHALTNSGSNRKFFRAFPALPDERMKAQEGFFIGSTVPLRHKAEGVLGFNPIGGKPGDEKLAKVLEIERGVGRPISLPFCAIVIPARMKDQIRDPLKHTYNRRRRTLFPDVDGFREGLARNQLD